MEDVEFTRAVPGDLAEIRALLVSAELPAADIEPHISNFIVARAGQELIGSIGIEVAGDAGLLRSLAVRPPYRGRGIAETLCSRLEGYARALGVRRLYLLTTTAEGYFRKRGYQRVPRSEAPAGVQSTHEFRSACPSTAACMRKDLVEAGAEAART
ncbi:MAG: arsenic resistance N-acetyltransferase ArsN2 [Acidobacteriota bacterium]